MSAALSVAGPRLNGAWGQKHRGTGMMRYIDAEAGKEVKPIAVDSATGAKIGSRAFRVEAPE